MEKRITKWTKEEGLYKGKETDPKAVFLIVVEFPRHSKSGMWVMQPEGKSDSIKIGTAVALTEPVRKRLQNMDSFEKSRFLWDLRFGLNSLTAEFLLHPSPDDLAEIRISHTIYKDGLTKDRFMGAVMDCYRSVVYVLWKFSQELGVLPTPQIGPPMHG